MYANGSARSDRQIPTPQQGRAEPGQRGFTLPATDYGAYMLNQLHEVLTQYGPVDEVWFDGAQGDIPPRARSNRTTGTAGTSSSAPSRPDAAIAVSGPDVRWVGNEDGHARQDEWSVVPVRQEAHGRTDCALDTGAEEHGSRQALLKAQPDTDYLQFRPGTLCRDRGGLALGARAQLGRR